MRVTGAVVAAVAATVEGAFAAAIEDALAAETLLSALDALMA